jgi:hypothetical protein
MLVKGFDFFNWRTMIFLRHKIYGHRWSSMVIDEHMVSGMFCPNMPRYQLRSPRYIGSLWLKIVRGMKAVVIFITAQIIMRNTILFIRGSIPQGHKHISTYSRGRQCSFISCLALLRAQVHPIRQWSRSTVDEIR